MFPLSSVRRLRAGISLLLVPPSFYFGHILTGRRHIDRVPWETSTKTSTKRTHIRTLAPFSAFARLALALGGPCIFKDFANTAKPANTDRKIPKLDVTGSIPTDLPAVVASCALHL